MNLSVEFDDPKELSSTIILSSTYFSMNMNRAYE